MKRLTTDLLPCVLMGIMTLLIAMTPSAHAVDYFWNVVNGNYTTPASWTPSGGPPTSLDNAYINNGGTATLTGAGVLGDAATDFGVCRCHGRARR